MVGATVTALGKACTTSLTGSCSISQMPPTTVSVTVAHADYNELTRDVVMQKGGLNFFTFDLQRK